MQDVSKAFVIFDKCQPWLHVVMVSTRLRDFKESQVRALQGPGAPEHGDLIPTGLTTVCSLLKVVVLSACRQDGAGERIRRLAADWRFGCISDVL